MITNWTPGQLDLKNFTLTARKIIQNEGMFYIISINIKMTSELQKGKIGWKREKYVKSLITPFTVVFLMLISHRVTSGHLFYDSVKFQTDQLTLRLNFENFETPRLWDELLPGFSRYGHDSQLIR